MNQPLWMPKRRIEVAFRRALLNVAKGIVAHAEKASDPAAISVALERLTQAPGFNHLSEAIAMKMVTGLFDDTGRTWREAARNNSRGREIYTKPYKKSFWGAVGGVCENL